jgi:hypothetical protein
VATTKADIKRARERRQKLINYLTATLTDPACPIQQNDWGHFGYVGIMYGASDLIDRFAAGFDDWPVMKEEILISIAVDVLNRLIR